MPCCVPGGCPAEAAASEKIRRATLEAMQREKLSETQNTLDQFHTLPTVDKSKLDDLSISYGPMLDVDDWSVTSPTEYQSKYFIPFDWPQDWLEYISWSVDWQWVKMDHRDLYSSSHLQFQYLRSRWFRARLCQLDDLDPEVWDVYTESMEMMDAVNLRLPRREFKPKARPDAHTYYEYGGQWAYLAKAGSDKSHAACLMLDSGGKDADGLLLRSEVDAAICMSQFQLRDGRFTDHHTKPILVITILREQVARLTQAHFDGKKNRLILRQSRLLDLSGEDAGDDAWLLLRWMASTPVGQTEYPKGTESVDGYCDEKTSVAPSMRVSDSFRCCSS
ncbi:uncharacterized protein BBA_08900 [Beauveria bassiana ARSEF 2860]|uniref:Uncharacterized protein n=1 Tax=Beauveria bassiana (strain ARSEF 2860) TaxID=655819 RepID=J5J6G4_BEAB2|nr:uncharacterized protein BBA_08900 [Beauveria bassiana ARSEF 2860]EJP62103.1 hypothetical protein BBA_08900 [Beauveria bassiana ARSEF 2860]